MPLYPQILIVSLVIIISTVSFLIKYNRNPSILSPEYHICQDDIYMHLVEFTYVDVSKPFSSVF